MATDTKPNLISSKFEQCVGDILNLSGCTQIYGTFDVHPQGSIDSCSGYKISGNTILNTSPGSVTSVRLGQGAGVNNNSGICNVFIGYNAGCGSTGSNRLYIGNTAACTLIYGDFTGNTVMLPTLKLCTTPSNGTCSDSVLVWNSTDKTVKKLPYSSGSTGGISTANNGLNVIGTNVRLGGALTGNTCISGAYTLGFSNTYVNITGNSGVNIAGVFRLISTPSAGSTNDELLIWNSSDKCVKTLSTSCMILSANNGLTKSGANVRMGGALTGNTAITGAYTLNICNGTKLNTTCGYQISGNTIFRTAPNTITSILIGYGAGNSTMTGTDNIAIGTYALCLNTSGMFNNAIGGLALCNNTIGSFNVAEGNSALMSNTCGCNNTALGYSTLGLNSSGCNNVSVGFASNLMNTTGSNNIGLGYRAGYSNSTGSNNVFIGTCAGYSETGSGKLYIATGATNQLIYGDFATKIVTLPIVKLCCTPDNGTCSNSILVWDSSSCCIKKVPYYSGSTGILTANNGLTKSGTNVRLGGALTGDTIISGSYCLSISGNTFFGRMIAIRNANSSSSGQVNTVEITPTYNQTGTAAATDLLINRTQIAVGSGAQYLIDAQVGSSSKFNISNTGKIKAVDGTVAELKFNSGYLDLTPSLAVGNTGASGKFAGLIAGTAGAVFEYDSAGYFAISTNSKTNYTNGALGNGTRRMLINCTGQMFIGNCVSPTAWLHIQAGTASAGTAPIKLNSGTNLTNPEAGALEYDGTNIYFTPSAARRTFAFLDSPAFTGTPTAPTASGGTNTTQIATTAFVTTALSSVSGGATVDDSAPSGTVGKLWFQPTQGSLMVYAGGAWVNANRNGIDGKGWTGGSYNASTGVVTFGSSDGLGFSTGDLRASLTDDSVTYAKLGTGFKNAITDNDGAFDFSAAGIITANISGTTTISFTNLQRNKTLKVKLVITNSATINFPSYAVKLAGSQTLGNGTFYLYFDCWESTGGSELVLYSIMKAA